MSNPGSGVPAVIHLSHFDEHGGAARSAYRLHEGLRRLGATSRMIVGHETSADPDVTQHDKSFGDKIANRIGYELGVQHAWLPSTRSIGRHPWFRDSNVVQLANIHGGWFSHTQLPSMTRGKRLVWCIHDMWSFTGHCGYSYGHDGWLTGCGACPHLDSYPALRRDGTKLNWKLKERLYRKLEMSIVAPSQWLGDLARRSPLLERFPVHVIPYGVDTDFFAPTPRAEARARLELPAADPLVLVAGLEPRKGSDLLGRILTVAEARLGRPVSLLVAGGTANADPPHGFTAHDLGVVDEQTMRAAYAASDVYLLPTLYDNLPNTVLEALSCETAVVATDVGGLPDMVEDGVNGLTRPADADALGEAVGAVLSDADLRGRLGAAGRRRAVATMGLEQQAKAYLDLYGKRYDEV
jgi:glycosyltransferase involved in cell wall biosynthesis